MLFFKAKNAAFTPEIFRMVLTDEAVSLTT
jgi:hypothetical protein